jgi:hypothetical protein
MDSSADTCLTLHWQALRRMDNIYESLLNLCGGESNELTTQTGVMARNWSYPATWETGGVKSVAIEGQTIGWRLHLPGSSGVEPRSCWLF